MSVSEWIKHFQKITNNNGLLIVAMCVVVVHGLTRKLFGYLTNKDQVKKHPTETDHPLQETNEENFISYQPARFSEDEMLNKSLNFCKRMNERRSARFISNEPVPMEVIENVIHTAGTSPSGAHTQPWTFVVVKSSKIKEKIKQIVEGEEEINYKKRMGKQWVEDLKFCKTNWEKPYLTMAPYIILVFKQVYGTNAKGEKKTHYYHEISVSIACGLLLAAIQMAGLVTLASTPLNAGPALREMVNRGKNEKLVLLLPVGYASKDCKVPDIKRKALEDIMVVV